MKIFHHGGQDLIQIVSRLVNRLGIPHAIYSISVLHTKDGEVFFGFEAESGVLEGIVDAIASDYWSISEDPESEWVSARQMISLLLTIDDENVFARYQTVSRDADTCESDQHPYYGDGWPENLI